MAEDLDTQPVEKTPKAWAEFWTGEMQAANKRLKKFLRQGNVVNSRYLAETVSQNDTSSLGSASSTGGNLMRTNFFHNNIQTLSAQLYGAVPKIDVSREHDDPNDDVARVSALMFQRMLSAEVSDSSEAFPTAVRSALQDRLLPGLGVARVRYDVVTDTSEMPNPMTGEVEEIETVTSEDAPIEYVHWQDFRWGWCRTWTELPWCGFRSYLSKEEAIERFGEKKSKSLTYSEQTPTGQEKGDDDSRVDNKDNIQTAQIWEIWRKSDGKVFWWSEGCDYILDEKDDPLELDNFWPMPRPLMANTTTSLMTPKADYLFAQDIYNEIDIIATRISGITAACKVVGVYDSSQGPSVGRMLTEGAENTLIPVESWAMLSEKGGLKGVIDWFPIQDVASVLALLNNQLKETKALLYEVTGMSDLVSGGKTDEYTSDGTNRLKAKFGSIKIQSFQDEFARFCSDLESIKAEVISKHFNPETIIKQSSAQFLSQPDQQYIMPAVQLMKSPEIKWRINIKPESISLLDYASLKDERVEYLNATSTFLQSAKPLITEMPESTPLILELMKFGLSAFKGADAMEGMLDGMIDNFMKSQQEGGGEQEDDQNAADLKKIELKKQADIELAQAKGMIDVQKIQVDNQADISVIEAKARADSQKEQEALNADLRKLLTTLNNNLKVEEAQSTFAIAETQASLDAELTSEEVAHIYKMREIAASKKAAETNRDD